MHTRDALTNDRESELTQPLSRWQPIFSLRYGKAEDVALRRDDRTCGADDVNSNAAFGQVRQGNMHTLRRGVVRIAGGVNKGAISDARSTNALRCRAR